MKSRCVKLVLAYDGTDFAGWQRQKDCRSVQEELETALGKMHGHEVVVIGAGRTDSGVHARGQVAHFHSDIASIPADRFKLALNKLLPKDVRILVSEEMQYGFHARFDARFRRYKYFIRPGDLPLPFEDRYAWRVFHYPDVARLNAMASCLAGELDCTSFASAKDASPHKYRYLYHACFYYEGSALVFDIAANAFLWRMVRSIVGTLMELDKNHADPEEFRAILAGANRELAGTTAPAHGLFLWHVGYYSGKAAARRPGENSTGNDCGGPNGTVQAAPGMRDGNALDLNKGNKRLVPGLGYIDE